MQIIKRERKYRVLGDYEGVKDGLLCAWSFRYKTVNRLNRREFGHTGYIFYEGDPEDTVNATALNKAHKLTGDVLFGGYYVEKHHESGETTYEPVA